MYGFAGDEPVDKGFIHNNYVSVSRDVDFLAMSQIALETSEGGRRLLPLTNSGGKQFLLTSIGAFDRLQAAGQSAVGRSKKIADTPFSSSLKQLYQGIRVPRKVSVAELRKLATQQDIDTPFGKFQATQVGDYSIRYRIPNQSRLNAHFIAPMANKQTWDEIIKLLGFEVLNAEPDTGQVSYRIAESAESVAEALAKAERKEGVVTTWVEAKRGDSSQLKIVGGEISVDGVVVPSADIKSAFLYLPVPFDSEALVIVEDEKPSDYWHIKFVVGMLAFIVVGLLCYLASVIFASKTS